MKKIYQIPYKIKLETNQKQLFNKINKKYQEEKHNFKKNNYLLNNYKQYYLKN